MLCIMLLGWIPIAVLWYHATALLSLAVPDQALAELSGQYLRILCLGCPGAIIFEAGKRFVQAQGLFRANAIVLFIAFPTTIFLHWLLMIRFGYGFAGAPMSVVVCQWLMSAVLLLYVLLIDGRQCWGGFTWRALHNWGHVLRSHFLG